ncbi:MAG: hypothetical protein HYX67_02170 [Candidatus Melainabacteria bacterium]|nr:hypothetical protein [Candidatus Melainabacteria bacterium]
MAKPVVFGPLTFAQHAFDNWAGSFPTPMELPHLVAKCRAAEKKFYNISQQFFMVKTIEMPSKEYLSIYSLFEREDTRPLPSSMLWVSQSCVRTAYVNESTKSRIIFSQFFPNHIAELSFPPLTCMHGKDDILVCATDKEIKILKIQAVSPQVEYTETQTIPLHKSVHSLERVGNQLFSGSNLISQWDTETGKRVATYTSDEAPITALCADEDSLISADKYGKIKLWDLKTQKCLFTLPLKDIAIQTLKFDRPFLYAMTQWGDVHALSLKKDKLEPITELKIDGMGGYRDIALKHGCLAVASSNGKNADEVEIDFSPPANLFTTLQFLADFFRKPYRSKTYTEERFLELDPDILSKIYGHMNELLIEAKLPNYTPDGYSAESVMFNCTVYPDLRDKIDEMIAKAIKMYLDKDLSGKNW